MQDKKGAEGDEKKEDDNEKTKKAKKPVKKTIPRWATLDASKNKSSISSGSVKMQSQGAMDVIMDSIRETSNAKGNW